MGAHLRTVINMFIEDTCVLVAVAYLLARGRMLGLLFRERLPWRGAICLGAVLGLVGLTEVEFPGARLPYATHTLIVTFAVLAGGLPVGLIVALIVAPGAFALRPLPAAMGMVAAMLASALAAEAIRRLYHARPSLSAGLIAGLLAQSGAVLARALLAGPLHSPYRFAAHLNTIAANGFGVMLLLLVVNDAQLRADSERHRAEAERAHALVAEAQLNALRASVHPHFLFNTLTSIAALCLDAPAQAEAAIVRLGQVMRRVLEANPKAPLCLEDEVEHVCSYLEIEKLRIGDRLWVNWAIDPECRSIRVPPFALQTLVENAVQHGISPKMEPSEITITIRRSREHTLVAVRDDGLGMTRDVCRTALTLDGERRHGIPILTRQLTLLYGQRARLRLFSGPDRGTLAVFAVPNGEQTVVRSPAGGK